MIKEDKDGELKLWVYGKRLLHVIFHIVSGYINSAISLSIITVTSDWSFYPVKLLLERVNQEINFFYEGTHKKAQNLILRKIFYSHSSRKVIFKNKLTLTTWSNLHHATVDAYTLAC